MVKDKIKVNFDLYTDMEGKGSRFEDVPYLLEKFKVIEDEGSG